MRGSGWWANFAKIGKKSWEILQRHVKNVKDVENIPILLERDIYVCMLDRYMYM